LDPFPEDVRQFLAANIDSLEQLETLRILGEDASREWELAEIAGKVQTPEDATLAHLTVLEARGLLRSERREKCTVFRYGPRTPELELQIRNLLELYRQRPVSMIRMVYQRADNTLKDFSDAFKFRREN
jgi:hypothetical protein